jgi:hypothetical protein
MLHRVALVRSVVSDEISASIIRVTRIGELGTTLAVTINRRTLRRNTKLVGFEVLTAVVMNVVMFWDMVPCSQCVKRRFFLC